MKNSNLVTKRWLTIEDAAKYLGVSQDTLRRWEKKDRLIPRRTMGGHRRYLRRQLEAVLKQPFPVPESYVKSSISKKEYQKPPKSISIPPTPPISKHQYTSVAINKYKSIYDRIKSLLPTLIIGIGIVSFLVGSYLLFRQAQAPLQTPSFVSPLP